MLLGVLTLVVIASGLALLLSSGSGTQPAEHHQSQIIEWFSLAHMAINRRDDAVDQLGGAINIFAQQQIPKPLLPPSLIDMITGIDQAVAVGNEIITWFESGCEDGIRSLIEQADRWSAYLVQHLDSVRAKKNPPRSGKMTPLSIANPGA